MIEPASAVANCPVRRANGPRLALAYARPLGEEPSTDRYGGAKPARFSLATQRALEALASQRAGEALSPAASGREAAGSDLARFAVLAANLLLIAGGAAVSIVPPLALRYGVFVCFLAGHTTWFGYAMRGRDRGLAALNAGLILLDLYAIAIRL